MTSVTMEWESRLGRRLRVRDLYILSTVVQTGGMAKAARHLAMTQPAVSAAIGNLEHMLGVRLLDRWKPNAAISRARLGPLGTPLYRWHDPLL